MLNTNPIKLKNGPFLASFSLFLSFLDSKGQINTFQIFHCKCLDSNCGSLVSVATSLPTVPHPRPYPSKANEGKVKIQIGVVCHHHAGWYEM